MKPHYLQMRRLTDSEPVPEPDLLPPQDTQDTQEEHDPKEEETDESLFTGESSVIDTKEIASLIGITEKEYVTFLHDFYKESLELEPKLRGNDLKENREAISLLKEASLLLHIPHIAEKLHELANATSNEKAIIDSYYAMVSDILPQSSQTSTTADMVLLSLEEDEQSEEAVTTSDDIQEKPSPSPIIEQVPEETTAPGATAAPTDILDPSIEPIPFEFSLKEAAEELSLPVSLVSEFVIDFINQSKENIPVLQQAYEDKDLEKIQKTAHMLKGASSNLRITVIADTLYSLQFNDDLQKVPELLKLFMGQLKALAIQMDQI